QLQAPPDVPLLVIATAMQPNVMRWRLNNGISDNGELRCDFLPASLPVQLAMQHPGTACDFTLPQAATITGRVLWPDAQPANGARVQFTSGEGTRLTISPRAEIDWQASGTLTPCGTADIDDSGRYMIPACPGTTVELTVAEVAETRIVGTLPR